MQGARKRINTEIARESADRYCRTRRCLDAVAEGRVLVGHLAHAVLVRHRADRAEVVLVVPDARSALLARQQPVARVVVLDQARGAGRVFDLEEVAEVVRGAGGAGLRYALAVGVVAVVRRDVPGRDPAQPVVGVPAHQPLGAHAVGRARRHGSQSTGEL